jgi:hypothetical protein
LRVRSLTRVAEGESEERSFDSREREKVKRIRHGGDWRVERGKVRERHTESETSEGRKKMESEDGVKLVSAEVESF